MNWRVHFMAYVGAALMSSLSSHAESQGFTVRDSIERTNFSEPSQHDPEAKTQLSPDGQHFLVVTSRGLLESDNIESTLSIFNVGDVRAYLESQSAIAPRNRPLVKFRVAPNRPTHESYQSIISNARWSPDSRSIYFLVQAASGERQLGRISTSGNRVRIITPRGYDVESFEFADRNITYRVASIAATRERIATESRGQRINADARDITGLPLESLLFPDSTVPSSNRYEARFLRISNKDRQQRPRPPVADAASTLSIWVKQSLDEPPTLWATDSKTGRAKELWNPNPQFSALKFGRATVYHWKDKTGYEWTGGLVRPVGAIPGSRYPLVIQTYWFFEHEFLADGAETTAEAAMPLASVGITVLQIQKRLDHADDGLEGTVQLPGFAAAIDQLVSDGLVDRERVGIIGFSRGCYYVALALTQMPDRFAAATAADGWDQSYMQHRMFEAAAKQDEPIYGTKPNGVGLAAWFEKSPGFNLDKVRAPLRIEAIGTPLAILSEWELYSALHEQGKAVDFIFYPLGDHILQRPLERLASQQGNVDWFRFWLQDHEDPDPAKEQQYKRWRELRKLRDAQLGAVH